MRKGQRFTKGDYIMATHKKVPAVVYHGTAMQTRDYFGWAFFTILREDGSEIELNLNEVEVELLFDAQVAREMTADDKEVN